jgi:hypothetical protein
MKVLIKVTRCRSDTEVPVPAGYELFSVEIVPGTPTSFSSRGEPATAYLTFVPSRQVK